MLGGFVILWQQSPQSQWFHSELKAWVHFIPLNHDLSDIFEKIDWLRNHEDEAERISQNAIRFSKHHFDN